MSPLEQRYRRLLTWLPEPARSRWADDMTETYLQVETADDPEYAEFGSPSLTDRLDVARLALRLRLGAPGASVRAVATGRTVRLVAVAGTVALASLALLGLFSTAWLHGRLPFIDAPDLGDRLLWGPADAVHTVVSALTVALAVCAVRGLAATRPLAVVVLVGHLVPALVAVIRPVELLVQLTIAVPLVAAALMPTGAPLHRPLWLVPIPLVASGSVAALRPEPPPEWTLALFDPMVQWALLTVVVGAVLVLRRGRVRGPAELAVAVLALATLPALLVRWPYENPPGYATVVVVVTLAAVAMAVVTGVVGLRAVRALPVVPADR
ncbi:hypothetical protein O2W15_06680 [Modestobacter sp. VKM Ac-2979]|uniref:hypothetical protein n=1 Tax=unclassified Modestobacter TaxID=2643866 RepID=UPI0022AB6071|nr:MULTISPECIES: hypothetical protein [unclassified Modestobacter]MCZ2811118.1 hypothetical protein [Modestobacter sp. VKM Ac-2979]MCZ2840631.1 hypothetical protein [Modestobacter sp. VKM Ac-2980]